MDPPASATTQFCAGEPSDAGLAAAYNWSFDGVSVRAADEMCDKMRVRIHETALIYAVAADGRLWVRSCSAKAPFANRDAQRLGSLLQKLLDAAPSPIPSVQMLVNHGDQPVMQKAQLGGGLPVFDPAARRRTGAWRCRRPSTSRARSACLGRSRQRDGVSVGRAHEQGVVARRACRSGPHASLDAPHAPAAEGALDCAAAPDLMDVRLSGLDRDSLEHALGADDIGARATICCSPPASTRRRRTRWRAARTTRRLRRTARGTGFSSACTR